VPQSTTLPCAPDNLSDRWELISCIQVEEYLYLALYTKIYHLLVIAWISLLNPRVAQLVKKFTTFQGTQIFTTVFRSLPSELSSHHLTPIRASSTLKLGVADASKTLVTYQVIWHHIQGGSIIKNI
jgi:hypothetical protein